MEKNNIQMCEHRVQCGDCVRCAPLAAEYKLLGVQCGWEAVLQVCRDQSHKALHNNRC